MNRITVVPFQISFDDLCNESVLFKQFNDIENDFKHYLKISCNFFHETEFKNKYYTRHAHEQLTSNDCFSVLKQKHEFIAYYDTDEYVHPQTLDSFQDLFKKSTIYNCDNTSRSSICSKSPFNFNNNNSVSKNNFYNYLQSLIDSHRKGRNINKLGSISFVHGATIANEKKLIYDLRTVIDSKNLSLFPFKINLNKDKYNKRYIFTIQKEDMDYVKYLYGAYNSFISCAYEGYLRKIDNEIVDQSHLRYLYINEKQERMGKEIHYYKNVKSVFNHYAKEKVSGSWSFEAPALNGHLLRHYRSLSKKRLSMSTSIKNLNIDFEYTFFLLKKFTKFC